MLIFLTNRIIQSFIVLLAMSLLVFAAVYAIGNPIDVLINPEASEEEKLKTIKNLGLDKSLFEQYFIFLKNAFKGELGYSFVHNRPAITLILERLPATLELTISALLIAIIFGIPLGVIAGLNPNNLISKSILAMSIFFFSLPTFWVGLILIMLFAVSYNFFPSTGRGDTIEIFGFYFSSYTSIFTAPLWTLISMGFLILPLSFACLSIAPKYTTSAIVSLIMLLEMVIGPFWVWVGIGETPSNSMLVGGLIVLIVLALHIRRTQFN